MEQEYKYMVVTSCMTYNHAPYIVDAMNGFTMQETTFPVYYLITDDASTDGEPEVIKQYLADHFQSPYRIEETDDYYLIFANHNTNPNCIFIVFLLKYNHYSIKKSKFPYQSEWRDNAKYIAICEGDDYWIHPIKLQSQVDFLERHLGHSLCIHAYRRDYIAQTGVYSEEIKKYDDNVEIVPEEDVLLGTGMFAATASMVFRASSCENYPEWARKAPIGDKPLQLVLFSRGHIGYLNTVMSVYRVGSLGSWTERMRNKRKYRWKTQKGIIKFYKDFDKWTERRYHESINAGLKRFKKAIILQEIRYFLHRPYHFLKRLFGYII